MNETTLSRVKEINAASISLTLERSKLLKEMLQEDQPNKDDVEYWRELQYQVGNVYTIIAFREHFNTGLVEAKKHIDTLLNGE